MTCFLENASSCRVKLVAESAPLSAPVRNLEQRIVRPDVCQSELEIALDRREQVVEVVRDAAGKPPDRLHLLRLDELHLHARPLGDVPTVDHEAGNRAIQEVIGSRAFQPSPGAVGVLDAQTPRELEPRASGGHAPS